MLIRARIFFNWKVIFLLIGDDLCHNPLRLGLPSSISVVLTLRKAFDCPFKEDVDVLQGVKAGGVIGYWYG